MDLSKLDIPETIRVHLEFPGIGKLYDDDKKTKPTTIDLFSPASAQAIAYKHKMQKKTLKRLGRKGIRSLNLSSEEMDANEIERLVAFTASVNNLTYSGESITTKDVIKVYDDPKMGWLCDQLRERLGSWDDFLS